MRVINRYTIAGEYCVRKKMLEGRGQMADEPLRCGGSLRCSKWRGRRKESLFYNLFNCFQLNSYLRQAALGLTAILLMLLTACGTLGLLPTSQLVQKAIALQLEQTQQQLSQKLDLDFQGFDIKRLSITEQKPLTIESLPAFRVRGNYDLIIKLPKRRLTQLQQPFEVYLQVQQEGKTWRLLLPERVGKDTQPIWHSYLIL
jgi:hypothetical protein